MIREVPDNSIEFGIHSPPFANLYIYSDSEADMGNCADDEEFIKHYEFLIGEMFRATVPGRLCAVHCKDLPKYANRDDTAGLKDFPGQIIAAYERHGWSFHSRVTIWKCPVTERERTNNNGLLHKTVLRDRSQLRQGMADYLIVFRKPPVGTLMSDKPITRTVEKTIVDGDGLTGTVEVPAGFDGFVGDPQFDPRTSDYHPSPYARGRNKKREEHSESIDVWRRYAEPVWWDISQTDVLNKKEARSESDERHICLARGTLILTRSGYKPIQEVAIGDEVLTHLGRWRPVIAKEMTGVNKVLNLVAQGVPGMRITPNHKLWARKVGRVDKPNHKAKKVEPDWLRADESAFSYVNQKLPPIEESNLTNLEWWLVGRYIADGHFGKRNSVHISIGNAKYDLTIVMLGKHAGFVQDTGTSKQVRLRGLSSRVMEVLHQCGRGAENKKLPPAAYCLNRELSRSLLDGYLSGDGSYDEKRKRWMASSVSKELMLGISFLAQRVFGMVACVYPGRKPGTTVIEGRTVNTKQDWILNFNTSRLGEGVMLEDGAWKKVRSVKPDGESETWNIRVLEDESYTAEGCVVKNCPLQLGLIRRAVAIWSMPGEVVFSPFAGIGSEGVGAIQMGRKFFGIELKKEYYDKAIENLDEACKQVSRPKTSGRLLFDREEAAS